MKICNHATLEMLQNLMEEFKSAYARKDAIKFHISADDVSPAELFGGTWQKVEGRFLLGASSGYAAGSTGGAATHNHGSGTLFAGLSLVVSSTLDIADTGGGVTWSAKHRVGINGLELNDKAHGDGVQVMGNTGSQNSMPPYLAVNIWKRVA